jgi:hypothetical protein
MPIINTIAPYQIIFYPQLLQLVLVANFGLLFWWKTGVATKSGVPNKERLIVNILKIIFIFIFFLFAYFIIKPNFMVYYDEFGFLDAAQYFARFSKLGVTLIGSKATPFLLDYYNWPPVPAVLMAIFMKIFGTSMNVAFVFILIIAGLNLLIFSRTIYLFTKDKSLELLSLIVLGVTPIFLKNATALSNEIVMIFFALLAFNFYLQYKEKSNLLLFILFVINTFLFLQCRFELAILVVPIVFTIFRILKQENFNWKYVLVFLFFIGGLIVYIKYPLYFASKHTEFGISIINFSNHIIQNLAFFILPNYLFFLVFFLFIFGVYRYRKW